MLRLLNSAVMPQPGEYRMHSITAKQFRDILRERHKEFVSYIGYAQTADHIRELTGISVPVSREATRLEDGDIMLICRLAYRVADPATKGSPVPAEFEYFACGYRA